MRQCKFCNFFNLLHDRCENPDSQQYRKRMLPENTCGSFKDIPKNSCEGKCDGGDCSSTKTKCEGCSCSGSDEDTELFSGFHHVVDWSDDF